MGRFAMIKLVAVCCLLSVSLAKPADQQIDKRSISYLPFYGGGKGQYLEVTKDKDGSVVKETIISENDVKYDEIIDKPTDDKSVESSQFGSKNIFEQNLQTVHSAAQRILALQQIAKKSGSLSLAQQEKLKAELKYLSESAGHLASYSESVNYDISALLGSKDDDKKDADTKFEENVGEEGIGVDIPVEVNPQPDGSTVAEAKPVGLAIAGEGGTASSRPVATAVVANGGVAVARPVATAIAGVDPAALGVGLGGIVYGKM